MNQSHIEKELLEEIKDLNIQNEHKELTQLEFSQFDKQTLISAHTKIFPQQIFQNIFQEFQEEMQKTNKLLESNKLKKQYVIPFKNHSQINNKKVSNTLTNFSSIQRSQDQNINNNCSQITINKRKYRNKKSNQKILIDYEQKSLQTENSFSTLQEDTEETKQEAEKYNFELNKQILQARDNLIQLQEIVQMKKEDKLSQFCRTTENFAYKIRNILYKIQQKKSFCFLKKIQKIKYVHKNFYNYCFANSHLIILLTQKQLKKKRLKAFLKNNKYNSKIIQTQYQQKDQTKLQQNFFKNTQHCTFNLLKKQYSKNFNSYVYVDQQIMQLQDNIDQNYNKIVFQKIDLNFFDQKIENDKILIGQLQHEQKIPIIPFRNNIQILQLQNIRQISLQGFENLRMISLQNCNLKSFDFCPSNVVRLDLSRNKLQFFDLNILNCKTLQLDLSRNSIQDVQHFQNSMNNMQILNLKSNKLQKFFGKNLKNLRQLDLSFNLLQKISFVDLQNIQVLNLSNNRIEKIEQRKVFLKLQKVLTKDCFVNSNINLRSNLTEICKNMDFEYKQNIVENTKIQKQSTTDQFEFQNNLRYSLTTIIIRKLYLCFLRQRRKKKSSKLVMSLIKFFQKKINNVKIEVVSEIKQKIFIKREKSAIKIQSHIRKFIIKKKVKKLDHKYEIDFAEQDEDLFFDDKSLQNFEDFDDINLNVDLELISCEQNNIQDTKKEQPMTNMEQTQIQKSIPQQKIIPQNTKLQNCKNFKIKSLASTWGLKNEKTIKALENRLQRDQRRIKRQQKAQKILKLNMILQKDNQCNQFLLMVDNLKEKAKLQAIQEIENKKKRIEKVQTKSFILNKEGKNSDIFKNIQVDQRKREYIRSIESHKPWYSFYFIKKFFHNNPDVLSYLMIELNLNLINHPLHCLKTRIQSKNKFNDVSFFLKNKVSEQSVYKGISYSIYITVFQAVIFSTIQKIGYFNDKIKDQKQRFLCNLIASDLITSPLRHYLDVIRIQKEMNIQKVKASLIFKKWKLTYSSYLIRDLSFRFSYYLFCKKTIEKGKIENSKQLFGFLLTAYLSILLIAPFDLAATRLTSQQIPKYNSMIDCIRTTYRQEGIKKLTQGHGLRYLQILASGYAYMNFYQILYDKTEQTFDLNSLLEQIINCNECFFYFIYLNNNFFFCENQSRQFTSNYKSNKNKEKLN